MKRARAINAVGAVVTAVVLVIVLITKFTHGAWIVVLAMPTVFWVMTAIRRHYDRVDAELRPGPAGVTLPSRIHAVVLVSKLHTPTLRALAFARATRPTPWSPSPSAATPCETAALERRVDRAGHSGAAGDARLAIPRRHPTGAGLHPPDPPGEPRDVVSVFVPEYVVGHWWEHLLHNQSALRLKARMLFQPGVMLTSVPWQLGSAEALEARRARVTLRTWLKTGRRRARSRVSPLPRTRSGLPPARRRGGLLLAAAGLPTLTAVLVIDAGHPRAGERSAALSAPRRGRRVDRRHPARPAGGARRRFFSPTGSSPRPTTPSSSNNATSSSPWRSSSSSPPR